MSVKTAAVLVRCMRNEHVLVCVDLHVTVRVPLPHLRSNHTFESIAPASHTHTPKHTYTIADTCTQHPLTTTNPCCLLSAFLHDTWSDLHTTATASQIPSAARLRTFLSRVGSSLHIFNRGPQTVLSESPLL